MQKSNLLLPANEVCEGYVFTRVCLSTGDGGLQAHSQGEFQGSGWGVSRTTSGGAGGIPACIEADPPQQTLLLRTVRILLECILVLFSCLHDWVKGPTFFSSKFINSSKFRRYGGSGQSNPIEIYTKNNIQMYLSVEKHLPATT